MAYEESEDYAQRAMGEWMEKVRRQTEEAFVPWFLSYWTQQWISIKVAWYGSNRNIAVNIHMCYDEFELCQFNGRVDDQCTPYWWTILARYIDAYASSVDGCFKELNNAGLDCRIEFIRIALCPWNLPYAQYNADVWVYEQDGPGGAPGTLLGHKEILAADINDYYTYGTYTVVDFSDLNIRTNTPTCRRKPSC